ncbi:MAG: 23S rRNA (uracil(1939)-C(5))-methyltransferase RlmD [Bacteroidales bacterium]|nr:23S rRNA (uracil(1939)-C(5))-methyltransferase RlmD [Bacteroidales bacterium]
MRKKKVNYTIEDAYIEGFAAEGNAILKHDEKVIFVPFVAPGDVADIEVYKQKHSFCLAKVKQIKKFSDKRIEVKCPHFTYCGGCSWQMLDYDWQKKYKQQQVRDNLERIGEIDCENISEILGSDNIYYYRNKLEFTFSNRAWKKDFIKDEPPTPALGFHCSGFFDKVLPIETCVLQKEPSNAIRNFIRDFTQEKNIPYYNIREHNGMMRNLIIRSTEHNDLMVVVVFAMEDEDTISMVMNAIKEKFPQITSLQYCINQKFNDSLSDQNFIVFSGKDHIMEYMPRFRNADLEPLQFKIRPKTFYQTNAPQAYKLYTVAAEFADIKSSDIVYDLYTGTGTIANFVANCAEKVVGIEYVEDAVEDARINSKENGINNTSFFAGDMVKVLDDEFIERNGRPDVIITDPPRSGMAEKVVQQILKTEARKIVYISCNPATQARDLKMMKEKYRVTKIQPVDMFPHTHHIENVVLLEKI